IAECSKASMWTLDMSYHSCRSQASGKQAPLQHAGSVCDLPSNRQADRWHSCPPFADQGGGGLGSRPAVLLRCTSQDANTAPLRICPLASEPPPETNPREPMAAAA